MKKYLRPFFSQKQLDQYGVFKDRIKKSRLYFGGIYFSLFKKTYKVDGLEFIIPFELTNFKFRGRFVFDTYEKHERTYLKPYLNRDATVLELGACIGVVSCLTNQLLENRTNHVVVEANPILIEWLEKNKNHNASKFGIENCMVANQKEVDFYIHPLIVGGSSVRTTDKKVKIPGKTIQEIEHQYQLQFDTLIMDIEGGELEILRNERGRIGQFRQIFMEVHPFGGMLSPTEGQECEDILIELGFKLVVRNENFQIWQRFNK